MTIRPLNWKEKKAASLKHAMEMLGIASAMDNFQEDRDPEFDYLKQAEELAFQANKLRTQSLTQGPNIVPGRQKPTKFTVEQLPARKNANPKMKNMPLKEGQVGRFIRAIAGQESGGNYSAVNPDSGAAGKYQIMPANFTGPGGWDQDALGRDISLKFYMNHPKVQERIARNKLREYFQQYGPAGAASAWYSGDPNNYNDATSQGAYPSIEAYVESILRRMGAK